MRLFNWPEDADYTEFKKTMIHGKTGREWMIRIIEDVLRKDNRLLLSEILIERISDTLIHFTSLTKPGLILIENLGFWDELMYYTIAIQQRQEKMLVIYMKREGFTYDKDSRQDISADADWILNHPEEIIPLVDDILSE